MGLMKAFVIAFSGFNIGVYVTMYCFTKRWKWWYIGWTVAMLLNIGVTVWSR